MSSNRTEKSWKSVGGQTISETDAQKMADQFESEEIDLAHLDLLFPRRAGRPSLTGKAENSPRVTFRISQETRDQAQKAADAQGTTVSELARTALESYLRDVG